MLQDKKTIIKWKKENSISEKVFWKIIKNLIITHKDLIKKILT